MVLLNKFTPIKSNILLISIVITTFFGCENTGKTNFEENDVYFRVLGIAQDGGSPHIDNFKE